MYSDKYQIAGRVDCVAEFNGIKSVIDFKSANRSKNENQIQIHATQETGYSIMWEEMTEESIEQIVTIVACENGESQTLINKPYDYMDSLGQCIKEFHNYQITKSIIKE